MGTEASERHEDTKRYIPLLYIQVKYAKPSSFACGSKTLHIDQGNPADLVVLHSATLYKCWLLFHQPTSYIHAIILGFINFFPKIGG
jgi:hypothetical protein